MSQSNVHAEAAAEATKEILTNHDQLKEGCSIIGYECRNWSGKKTFTEGKVTAINTSGNDVELPTDLVSAGRKSLLDTKTHLSFCNKFASRLSRLFNKYGIKFLGNYLVADSLLPALLDEVQEDIKEYELEVDEFCGKYESLIDEWCVKHPGLESVIRDGYMTTSEVRSRFKLRVYRPVRFSPRVEEDLAEIVGEASAQLFEDIAKEAQGLITDSLTVKKGASKGSTKESCTQDIKRPLKRLRDKVFSLYMLDPTFEGVVDVFDELLDRSLPDSGKIVGNDFSNLMAHVMMMTDPAKLKLHASGVNQIAAKVAEVEQEEIQQEETPTVDIDDEESQLLAKLAEIRKLKSAKKESKPAVSQSLDTPVEMPVETQPTVDVQQAVEVPMDIEITTDFEDVNEVYVGEELSVEVDVEPLRSIQVEDPSVATTGFFF